MLPVMSKVLTSPLHIICGRCHKFPQKEVKPIFHENANPFALGPHVGLDHFTQNASQKGQRGPHCVQVEYGSRWESEGWVRVGHADFMLFVFVLFTFGT